MNMAKNNMRPIHPGEILREEFLAPLGMSSNALSIHLRVPAPRINDVVREKRGVTTDTALRLARYFNTTAQYWLNLQSSYDLKQTESLVGNKIENEIHPMQMAA
jgi:addiction module HigA family antidote